MKKQHLSFLLTCAYCMLLCVSLTACPDDKDDDGNVPSGLKGWYTDLSYVAKESDFDELNEAINNHEKLSSYYYGGEQHTYYATRDFFFPYGDGMYSDSNGHYGRLRFSIHTLINAIQIVDDQTLLFYCAILYEDGAINEDAVYKFYAGPIFGNMAYYGEGYYYTYAKVDNKLIVSNGDIYTIVSGGLVKDGSSGVWSKYDPSKRY